MAPRPSCDSQVSIVGRSRWSPCPATTAARSRRPGGSLHDAFTRHHAADLLRLRHDVTLGDAELGQPDDVAELSTAHFEQDDGQLEAEPVLQQPELVDWC